MSYPEDRVSMSDERVAQILNDINEGIDNGEGRIVLRCALRRHSEIMRKIVDKMQQKQIAASVELLKLSTELLKGGPYR
jgi:hypothetical protein